MKPTAPSTAFRIALLALSALIGFGALAVQSRFGPGTTAPELIWLTFPALLGASAAMSVPDRSGALWLMAGLTASLLFTALVLFQTADPGRRSSTGALVPTFLPLWQIGIPAVLWCVVWCVGKVGDRG